MRGLCRKTICKGMSIIILIMSVDTIYGRMIAVTDATAERARSYLICPVPMLQFLVFHLHFRGVNF